MTGRQVERLEGKRRTIGQVYTVEPLNKGHFGTRNFILYREVSFIWRLECTGIYTVELPNKGHIGTRNFVLYREVSFTRPLKCTGKIGIGTSRDTLEQGLCPLQRGCPLFRD